MVNILRHASASPVVDEQAMQTFRHQWEVYSKVVDNDYFSHQAVGAVLHRELVAEVNRPFRFLDLACGDARLTVAALQGTPVIHYHGIDLSAPALALARQTVEASPARLNSNRGFRVRDARAAGTGGRRVDRAVSSPPSDA